MISYFLFVIELSRKSFVIVDVSRISEKLRSVGLHRKAEKAQLQVFGIEFYRSIQCILARNKNI